ncbi:MAG: hypothetical protein LKE44_09150 [Eubacterium sp.]|jgi:hypothetical protein|nr:hypothetical protein [Eubacterium sp.]
MFDKQYRLKGRHAHRADQLTAVFDELGKAKLFDRVVDVYANAPLVGFLYGRKAGLDNTKDPVTGAVYDKSVMPEQLAGSSLELEFNFRLIILLDEHYEPDVNKRIDKAFKYLGQDQADKDLFESYVRGGIDVLYEKLITDDGQRDPDSYMERLYEFIEDFEDKFNNGINGEDIMKLCMK